MRRKLVAGNWKMHGDLRANEALVAAIRAGFGAGAEAECAVCVPYPYVPQVQALLADSGIALGAQDVSEHAKGAFTGEVSAGMLRELGCRYVIVGHSERRALFGETSVTVAGKFAAAQAVGLIPILCVGETLAQREAGTTQAIVAEQLDAVMAHCGVGALGASVLAYEPVWAIGTGRTATPEQAQEVHGFIRNRIAGASADVAGRLRILYGGSVKASNAPALFAMRDIDGGLIGGASLEAAEFLAIFMAASRASK